MRPTRLLSLSLLVPLFALGCGTGADEDAQADADTADDTSTDA